MVGVVSVGRCGYDSVGGRWWCGPRKRGGIDPFFLFFSFRKGPNRVAGRASGRKRRRGIAVEKGSLLADEIVRRVEAVLFELVAGDLANAAKRGDGLVFLGGRILERFTHEIGLLL